jgi:hypothetical protein
MLPLPPAAHLQSSPLATSSAFLWSPPPGPHPTTTFEDFWQPSGLPVSPPTTFPQYSSDHFLIAIRQLFNTFWPLSSSPPAIFGSLLTTSRNPPAISSNLPLANSNNLPRQPPTSKLTCVTLLASHWILSYLSSRTTYLSCHTWSWSYSSSILKAKLTLRF